jgi:hypothetical protein
MAKINRRYGHLAMNTGSKNFTVSL